MAPSAVARPPLFMRRRVETTEEFAPAFERAVKSGKPAILHCLLDPEAISASRTLTELREAALAKGGG